MGAVGLRREGWYSQAGKGGKTEGRAVRGGR